MKAKLILLAGAVSFVAACASTPEPEPMPEPAPAPAPVVTAPAPAAAPQLTAVERFVRDVGAERVFFAYDQSDLSDQAMAMLSDHAAWLMANPGLNARIEGNADERGTREYNLALGASRANAVRDYLIAEGVDPSRLTTISYGKDRPLDPRSNETAWSKNRNTRTLIIE